MRAWLFWFLILALLSQMPRLRTWQETRLPYGEINSRTLDCASKPEASEDIEVTFKNARNVDRKGARQVLIADGDGCYRLYDRLHMYGVMRDPQTKNVLKNQYYDDVIVTLILDMSFENLPPLQKTYASSRFKEQASQHRYQLVTLKAVDDDEDEDDDD